MTSNQKATKEASFMAEDLVSFLEQADAPDELIKQAEETRDGVVEWAEEQGVFGDSD